METRAARRDAAAVDMACVMTGANVGDGEDARETSDVDVRIVGAEWPKKAEKEARTWALPQVVFTHRSVSTFDRFPFQLTDAHV